MANDSILLANPTFGKSRDGVASSIKRLLTCVLAAAAGLSLSSLRAQSNVVVIEQHIFTKIPPLAYPDTPRSTPAEHGCPSALMDAMGAKSMFLLGFLKKVMNLLEVTGSLG